ncbi:hypothetical protein M2277_004988 [Paenibacillus sp. LBL]|uniref:hypothetical protein n=1 Tax=Paenibacillus sp. LBL TaxID=2940563 RepID=UPI002474FF77|nr:hypothetical protein [Paenibacillus sp. LBL]MDH6674296.1 hypothetical protein [Paenibacillus sp. LBL]
MAVYLIVDTKNNRIYNFESDEFEDTLKASCIIPVQWLADQLHEEMRFNEWEKVVELPVGNGNFNYTNLEKS